MDFSSLVAFVTVAQTGSLTRAAQRLNRSQPALSLQIKKLQSTLEITLFERTPRGMRLTPAGRKLLPTVERLLLAQRELEQQARGLSGQTSGHLRLGTIIDPEFLRMGAFLQRVTDHHPQISFELRHGMSGSVAEAVSNGELDVAYGLDSPGLPQLRQRFHCQPLTQFVYRVIAPPHWQARVQGKSWAELADLPWIGTPTASIHHRLLSAVFASVGRQPHVVARVDLEPNMMDLVKSGIALSLARESLALGAAHAHGICLADRVSIPAELAFICRPERQHEAAIAAALESVQTVWDS